jgi:hypothetical protein
MSSNYNVAGNVAKSVVGTSGYEKVCNCHVGSNSRWQHVATVRHSKESLSDANLKVG